MILDAEEPFVASLSLKLGRGAIFFVTVLFVFISVYCPAGNAAKAAGVDAVSGASVPVDGVSGASKPEFTLPVSVDSITALLDLMNESKMVSMIATTNRDATPYVAVIHPVFESEDVIRFASPPGQTRENLNRTGVAMLSVYGKKCSTGETFGARLKLKHLSLVTHKQQQTKGMRVIKLRVEQLLPLE